MDPRHRDNWSRELTIIYATETGNAQDYAGRVAHRCRRAHFKCRVFDVDKYPLLELVSENVIIFVVATSGTGKEPRTMTPLWKNLLRSDLPPDFFEDLHYAVFGLGDSSYEKFCWPAKKLSRRLEFLGARAICPRAEGDTQHTLGTDGAFDPWVSSLAHGLLKLFPLPPHLSLLPAEELPAPRITIFSATEAELLNDATDPLQGDNKYHMFELMKNERITAGDWYQEVRHFEFRCRDDIAYDPGDVAVIHPEASLIDVDSFLTMMGWASAADDPIRLHHVFEDQSLPDHLPQVSTLRALFTRHLDINAVPKRSFFQLLKHFATDEREREKLEEFSSPEGAEELYEYTTRVRRTIHEVLIEFRSARVPRDRIFDLFPPLRPREFSIASAAQAHPREVHLCVAIINYKTKLKARRHGVGTAFLASLPVGAKLRVGITKGLLALPPDLATPVICVGPGTGVAPARSLIEARVHGGSSDNTLYFGHRASGKDAHYAHEWTTLTESGRLAYHVAASRDGPEGTRRIYVQDLIRQDAKRIWELIDDKGAWVYISGSSNKMPAGVRAALVEVAQEEGKLGEDEARGYIARMEKEGRLFEECWS
ncbi:riboflavin synthase domain-like protein [Multifurca ochricompacta]|uniref:NADPH-dependent diflavin oxidoreductase 1 n=1 Tax=Multifurca ochricompacta TaxID=376703 RepID=A0AAD4M021_9AGAM|nr:riboflavin synthase domain-like protein [Multifurca ochricompacta]